MKVILASRNPSKVAQINEVFRGASITIVGLSEVGIEGAAVEDGTTLEENAMKKVRYVRERLTEPMWVMSDDTGIFIEALGGEPGVHAAYWGGVHESTHAFTEYIVERMNGIADRRAYFKTVVALVNPDGEEYFFEGRVDGTMREEALTEPQDHMPYSPLFVANGETRSWSEMSIEEENAISHRGIAFRKVREFFETLTPRA